MRLVFEELLVRRRKKQKMCRYILKVNNVYMIKAFVILAVYL